VAAVVNDSIITTYQLDQALQKALAGIPAAESLSVAEKDKLRRQLLEQLIEEELVKERVAQLRLKVDDEDVEAAVQDVQRQNNLTREQLQAALEQQGMDFDTYRENLRKQILRFRLIGIEVKSKAEVTSAEVRQYYREHINEYREPPFMHLSRLTFPISKTADKDKIAEIRNKAIAAQARLEDGESINTLMVSYATDGVDGGDMGRFRVGELSGLFDRAVRDLQTGEVSEVVETPNAYFIFKMIERSTGEERPFEVVSGEIEKILTEQKQEEAFKKWNRSLREEAYIDIRI
jgi:peptidyl-prolyl cis-trans isomerase SurA